MSAESRLVVADTWSERVFDGHWREASSTISVLEPATGEELGRVGASTVASLEGIAERAVVAQRIWASTGADERASVMRRAAELLDRERNEIIPMIMRETGGIRGKAETELNGTIAELIHSAALLIAPDGQVLPHPDPTKLSIARRVPLGVVGVITPWNFPMLLAMRSVAPAIALGNAVILKPDPQTAIVGGALLARTFEEVGVPAGIFSVVNGGADVGEALIGLPEVRLVTFTGSTAVGRRVGELAGKNLKKVALELGGKSPFIVLDDADLEAAASAGAWGSFLHQGQICMASGRHIVDRKVVDEYLDILTRKASEIKVGDPYRDESAMIGPIMNAKQLSRVDQIVRNSVSAGARLLTGGTSEGPFYRPTVLADVNPQVPAYHLEIFGPVAPVVVAEDEEDAIRIANDTEYGLSSAIQTSSLERGLRVAAQIKAGMVHINDQTISDLPGIPFGGVGTSGNGSRFGSTTNWDEFTQWQWMTAGSSPARYPF